MTPQTISVYSQEEKTNLACRSQIPLKLAYAITMHKAQGMTLNEAVINTRHANNPGQLATADLADNIEEAWEIQQVSNDNRYSEKELRF